MTLEADVMAERRRRVAGRVAIVTGASGGVGRGMVVFIAAYSGIGLTGQVVVSHPHRHRL